MSVTLGELERRLWTRKLSSHMRQDHVLAVCGSSCDSILADGRLIHTRAGNFGATGGPLWNRSGCAR